MKFSNMERLSKEQSEDKEHNGDIVLTRLTTKLGGMIFPGGAKINIRRRIVYHSPTGFEFGYGGSGPADLALNILYLFLDFPRAWKLHKSFKWDFIAVMSKSGGIITAAEIKEWIKKKLIHLTSNR